MIAHCPVCGSAQLETLYPDHEGDCVTSDMKVLPASTLKNCLCEGCGLIFNAGGTRGKTEEFYRSSYNLMMRDPNAAIVSFAGKNPVSQAERTFHILRDLIDLPSSGRILEAGAGKGDFLGHFVDDCPGWKIDAFEPSEAFTVLSERHPDATVDRCEYRDWPRQDEPYDLVVALGVLEHVENPYDMMVWANGLLSEGGIFYVRVPHFANNPNDLFCADHLSKLTEPTLRSLAAASGFEVVGVKEAGVPIFIMLRKIDLPNQQFACVADENREIAERNMDIARGTIEAILCARETAHRRGERFGIFGLGASGLFAPMLHEFPASEITAYIDENQSVWGGTIHGRPIAGLDIISSRDIKRVALAISPAYFEKVSAKLRDAGVDVYVAEI